MKKFLSIMVMLSLAVVVCRPVCAQNKDTHVDEKLQAVQELYNYYTELEDVTGIHISSSMLELLSVFSEGTDVTLDDFAVDDMTVVNHMDLKKLKSLYILVADNAKSASEMTKSANHNILKRFGDYIELLQISNIEEDVTFYYSSPDGQYVDDLHDLYADGQSGYERYNRSRRFYGHESRGVDISFAVVNCLNPAKKSRFRQFLTFYGLKRPSRVISLLMISVYWLRTRPLTVTITMWTACFPAVSSERRPALFSSVFL